MLVEAFLLSAKQKKPIVERVIQATIDIVINPFNLVPILLFFINDNQIHSIVIISY
ncbi:hypothetical protein BG09_3227 [Bacillus thuringiensis serovar kurstaki str. HD-1]|nr:hypothetical protein H175_285p283 [Bacillus thuringiensis serovar thuringiensis str. IS5056]KEH48049.1 hypothetical protein BG09_3227 [Bacillus thuringiensis serovar kurstaki str. HD-1]